MSMALGKAPAGMSKEESRYFYEQQQIENMQDIMLEMGKPIDVFDKIMRDLAYAIHAEIVETERVDTGRLRSSYVVQKITPRNYIIGTNVEYAPYVEVRFATVKRAIGKVPKFVKRLLKKYEDKH